MIYNTTTFDKEAGEKFEQCCVNSVVFHPLYEALVYCCGERNFLVDGVSDDEEPSLDKNCFKSSLMIKRVAHGEMHAHPNE